MIIKFYKNIHNSYLKYFKFFYFLRYLFLISFISLTLFLVIPKFFDFETKITHIKKSLLRDYNLELLNYKSIKFNVLPFPNISIRNANIKIKNFSASMNSENLLIFVSLKNIYNYENFKPNKLIMVNGDANIEINDLKRLFSLFKNLKTKYELRNFNINIESEKKYVLSLKNLKHSNFNPRSYNINGSVFNKDFSIHIDKKYQQLDFKLLNTGVDAQFELNNSEQDLSGTSKINILNNLIKLKFVIENSQIKIKKSNIKNKNISIIFNSLINFKPYFEVDTNFNIDKLSEGFIYNFDFERIIENKNILKKLNSKNIINYDSKSKKNLIRNYLSQMNLANGRINDLTKINFVGGILQCTNDILLMDEYPRLYFVCKITINDPKKFLRKLDIAKSIDNDEIDLKIVGSINALNKKINFEKVQLNENVLMKEEDLKFFKNKFEDYVLDEGFFKMFKIDKLKNFIEQVI